MNSERGPWTHFWDMHSGGSLKEEWQHIYIEAPEDEARVIFYNRFGHPPDRVSCTCCGEDYSVTESVDLKQATGYQRNCKVLKTPRRDDGTFKNDDPVIQKHLYLEPNEEPPEGYEVKDEAARFGEYVPLDEYVERDDVLVIERDDIEPGERGGNVPTEGYVWVGE